MSNAYIGVDGDFIGVACARCPLGWTYEVQLDPGSFWLGGEITGPIGTCIPMKECEFVVIMTFAICFSTES